MSEPKVRTSTEGGVLTITLADVEKRNVLGNQLCTEFVDSVRDANSDDDVRVVVVTNDGGVFCAGADLSERSGSDGTTVELADVFGAIRRSPKPFVGRIAGHAVAGGMGLAAAMDLSIAVDTAKLGFTEVRIGVAPAIISVICLPKMRSADAHSAFLRGNRFLAPEAVRLGLINQSVPVEDLDAAVAAAVDDLLEGSPAAIAAVKDLLQKVPTMEFESAMSWTAERSAELFDSPSAREGMAAYLEKRPPEWSPRAGS